MDDLQYYRRRLVQEEQAALSATCRAARERHVELAEAYRFKTRVINACRLTPERDLAVA